MHMLKDGIQRKDSSFNDSKFDSNFDYGSFQVGRSNFFRGNTGTVQEISVQTIHDMKSNLAVSPLLQAGGYNFPSEGSPMMGGPHNRRSSFSRFSGGREVTSFRDHHSMRDNPSISVSIAKDDLTSRGSYHENDA